MDTTTPMGMLQQPRLFFMISSVELWERSGYYGVQGVLAVFLVKQLELSQEQASVIFGIFTALVYGLISIGGYVGDHLLGTKCTVVPGTLALTIGYSMTGMSLLKPDLTFIALETIAVGNSLFKANSANLLSKCYPPKGPRLDGVFTLSYMSINTGSLMASPLTPVIADRSGHPIAYNLCGAGLAIALLVYIAHRGMVGDIGSEPDFRSMGFSKPLYVLLGSVVMIFVCVWLMYDVEVANLILIVLSIVVTITLLHQTPKLDKTRYNRVFVAFVLMFEAVMFYILYTQMPMSLDFFVINNVYHEIPGFSIDPISFQVLNPSWVVLTSPIPADIYVYLGNKGRNLPMPMKSALGMFMCSLGFLTAVVAGMQFADARGLTSSWFIMPIYLFQSLGKLFISALGLAMIAALAPQHLMGLTLRIWFLAQTAVFSLGGYVATFTMVPDNITDLLETLPVYTNVFGKIDLVTLGVAVVVPLTVPWLRHMIATSGSH